MNSPLKDYYKVLDLAPTATVDEVKRRYRELARRYHPDVNPRPEAALRIKVINEAYHHLGDAERRSLYDAERQLWADSVSRQRPSRSADPTAPHFGRSASAPSGGRPTRPSGTAGQNAGYDGFGRVPHAPPQQSPHATRVEPTADSMQVVDRIMTDARLAYMSRHYEAAERLCKDVLGIDRRYAPAHELLGDIFARRGHREQATAAYSYAIQFNPRNQSAQVKLEHILGRTTRPRQSAVTRPLRESTLLRLLRGPGRDLFLMFVSLGAVVALAVVLWIFYDNQGLPTITDEISLNLVAALGATGLLSGLLLALFNGFRPLSQEMVIYGRRPVGLGSALVGSAVIWFYASLVFYLLLSVRQNRVSLSVLRAYGATVLLIVLFVGIYQPAHQSGISPQTITFAGNLLFPAIVLGWRMGDWLRLGGA